MLSRFEELLKDLGTDLSMELKPDKLNACTLKIDETLLVQLKIDESQSFLLLGSKISEIPPGKFRENVFSKTLPA